MSSVRQLARCAIALVCGYRLCDDATQNDAFPDRKDELPCRRLGCTPRFSKISLMKGV